MSSISTWLACSHQEGVRDWYYIKRIIAVPGNQKPSSRCSVTFFFMWYSNKPHEGGASSKNAQRAQKNVTRRKEGRTGAPTQGRGAWVVWGGGAVGARTGGKRRLHRIYPPPAYDKYPTIPADAKPLAGLVCVRAAVHSADMGTWEPLVC